MSANLSRFIGCAIGALIGLTAFELGIGLELVNPRHVGWLMVGNDATIHFLGWHMFRHGAWSLPLGATGALMYPVGTSVALTDSIPAMAIPFKAFDPLLPRDFQYIGLWILSCYVLQGAFAVALMSTVTSRVTLQALTAALLVMAPPLLYRVTIGHSALSAHWVLIAALWLYVAYRKTDSPSRLLLKTIAVAAIASATHAYLALMVLVLIAGLYARIAQESRSRWFGSAAIPFALVVCVSGVVFWQSGYLVLGAGSDIQSGGFGWLSLNLLAPLMPMGTSALIRREPFIVATVGQYEGFCYLGAGVMLLAIAAGVSLASTRRDSVGGEWRRYVPLAIACGVLTLFALSPRITAGSRTLFQYPEALWGPLSVFRASGRMIWPAYYAMIFAVAVITVRRNNTPWAVAILSLAVALQAVDVSYRYRQARQIRLTHWEQSLRSDFWEVVPRAYRHLTLIPTNLCPATVAPVDQNEFALIAGRFGLTLNAGLSARGNSAQIEGYCREFSTQFANGVFGDADLYVVRREVVPRLLRNASSPMACTHVDGYGVCFRHETYGVWQDAFDLTRGVVPPVAELTTFRDTLEREYRERMKRPPLSIPQTLGERVSSIGRYLSYRRTGCGHAEAATKVIKEVAQEPVIRLCEHHEIDPGPLPLPNETLTFLGELDRLALPVKSQSVSTTYVDPEGEAAWMGDYVQSRIAGASDRAAADRVLAKIRAIAGT